MLTFKRWPPLRALIDEPEMAGLVDSFTPRLPGDPAVTWAQSTDELLDELGHSISSVLTRTERATFGTVYLELHPTVIKFDAYAAAVSGVPLIFLPLGLTHLTLLDAAGFEALSRLADFAAATERDVWPDGFHARLALTTLGEEDSLRPLRPEVRDAVTRCWRAVVEFDDLLRIAALGMASEVEPFPELDLSPDAWQFSDGMVSHIQWLFVTAHELGHIAGGDLSPDASSLRAVVPGHKRIRVFDLPEHKMELRADRYAARLVRRWAVRQISDNDLARPLPGRRAKRSSRAAARRDRANFMIGMPLDFLFYILRGLEDTHRFHVRREARRAGQPDPPPEPSTHPDGPTRRKNVSRIIGAARSGGMLDEVFELVNRRREGELERLVRAAP